MNANSDRCTGQKYTRNVQECISLNRDLLAEAKGNLANAAACDFNPAISKKNRDDAQFNVTTFTRYAEGYYARRGSGGGGGSSAFNEQMRRSSERSTRCAASNGGYGGGYAQCNSN